MGYRRPPPRPLVSPDAEARRGCGARSRGRSLRERGSRFSGAGDRRLRAARGRGSASVAPPARRPPGGRRPRRGSRHRRAGSGQGASMSVALPGTGEHPHARLGLGWALASVEPSHAYLFHGPPGTGKRTAARALAAEILAAGEASDPDAARRRVLAGTHPDLTWVRPTGAHVMRVSDVEEPVVAAATRTPFESSKRVFVLEQA